MEFLKKFFSGKAFGYYVTLAVSLLFLISGIVYVVQYAKDTRDYQILTTVLLFVGFAVSVVLLALKQDKYTPYVQGVFSLCALLFFIRKIYWYISEVFVGIDEIGFNSKFIISTTFLVILFVATLVNCFLPQVKKEVAIDE